MYVFDLVYRKWPNIGYQPPVWGICIVQCKWLGSAIVSIYVIYFDLQVCGIFKYRSEYRDRVSSKLLRVLCCWNFYNQCVIARPPSYSIMLLELPDAKIGNYGLVRPYTEGNYSMTDSNDNSSYYNNVHPESKTLLEATGFSQINNNVINNIKNGDAFLVWCYLYSKSSNWKTIKSNIKNVYGFGDAKINKIFSYLNRAKLIEYVQGKCAKGTFKSVQIRILNGSKFDKTQAWTEVAPHVQKPVVAVNCTNGNDELLNKDITKDLKEHNTESNSASGDAHIRDADAFDTFWDIYPVKKNKIRAKKIWERSKLNKISVLICNDISLRLVHDSQWQQTQFIPHPSTYLQNELWKDEITKSSKNKSEHPITASIRDFKKTYQSVEFTDLLN